MNPVAIAFGVATAAVVAWCFLGGRRDRWVAAAASVVLACGWAGCRLAEVGVGWDDSPDAYALVDLISAFAMAMLWARSERRFVIVLLVIFSIQSGLHLFYQADGRKPGGIYPYLLALDVLYAMALIVLAFGGRLAADVVSDLGGRVLRRLRSRRLDNGSPSPEGSGARSFPTTSWPLGAEQRLGRSLRTTDSRLHFSEPRARDRGTRPDGW